MVPKVETTFLLMVAALSCDILRSLIEYVSLLFIKEETSLDEWFTINTVAISLSGALLAIASICLLLCGLCYQCCRKDDDDDDDSKTICITLVCDVLMLISTWFYFSGNSLTSFYITHEEEADNYREASQVLLLVGLTGFVLIPQIEKSLLQFWCNQTNEETQEEDGMRFTKFVLKSIAMLLKIDALYTIFTNLNVECSTAQRIVPWVLYVVILIAVIPYLIFQVQKVTKYMEQTRSRAQVWLMAIVIGFLVATFLLSDNNQPLDCSGAVKCTIDAYSNSTAIPGPHCTSDSSLRLVLTMLSIGLYGIPMITALFIFVMKGRHNEANGEVQNLLNE